ncbi:MAG: hypothetical protein WC678_03110 [Parcubacteria group bacterium]|jgi:hypothetical protein
METGTFNFEEARKKDILKKLCTKITKKIHPDNFHIYGKDIFEEADKMFRDFQEIKRENSESNDLDENINRLNIFERRVDEFIERVNKKASSGPTPESESHQEHEPAPESEPNPEPNPKPNPEPEPEPEPKPNQNSEPEDEPTINAEDLEDKELNNLISEVEKARKAYTKKDYEITNVYTSFKDILKGHFHPSDEILKERQYYFQQYKLALNNLLNHKIEKLKEGNLPPDQLKKEMGDLAKYYNQDEKTNLYEAHTNARAEVWEQKFGKDAGWLAKTSGKFIKYTNEKINDYRKLNWKKKMAFGIGAGLVGAGFLVVGQRILGGAVAGAGTTAWLEGRYRKKEGQKRKKEQQEIFENIESVENPEEKFEALMARLQQEIDNFDKDLMNEKSEATMRKIVGSAIGIFLSSGVMSQIMHLGMDKAGLSEAVGTIKESYLGKTPEVSAVHSGNAPLTEQQIFGETNANIPPSDIHIGSGINPENIAQPNIELTIPEGSSFEGSIIKHLTENGMDKHQAGIEAHKMWSEFIKTHPDPTGHGYDIVHPNAHLEISSDGKSILNFEDSPKAEWPKMPETKMNIEKSVGADSVPASENINIPEVEKIMPDSTGANNMIAGSVVATTIAGVEANNISKFIEKRALKKMAKKYEIREDTSFSDQKEIFIKKIAKEISLGKIENWKKIKDRKISELTKNDKTIDLALVKNIKKTEKYFVSILGEKAKFNYNKNDETVKQWVLRIIKDSLEKNNSEKKAA